MKDMLLQVEPLIPALRRYARALLRNRANADDLVQDCLERAVSRWYQRRDGDVRAWLFTILHNLAINQFRQSASRGRHVPIEETNEDNFGEAAAQEQKLMYQDVLNKLAKLPEDPAGGAAACCRRGSLLRGCREGAQHSRRDRDVAAVPGARKAAAGN